MRGSPDQLRLLGPLLVDGKLEELRKLMVAIWPPDSYMDEEDVGYITMLLRGVRNLHGEKGRSVYTPFSSKLKSPGERRWLRTLDMRAETVQAYEGLQDTLVWLVSLGEQTPPPNDGVFSLAIGRLHYSAGNHAAAREHFLRAVERSLVGVEWYRLEALNGMAMCLARLGESRLAFEYARTVCVESFKLGRTTAGEKIGEYDLYKSVYTLALLFGQVEYAIDIRKNLADRFRMRGKYSASSEFASDAGYRLAQVGAGEDAIVHIRRAAQDAEMSSEPFDAPFAAALHLLAMYLDEEPVRSTQIEKMLELSQRFAFPPMEEAIQETKVWVGDSTKPQTAIERVWQQVVTAHDVAARSGVRDGRVGRLMVGVHGAAIMSRFLAELGHSEAADSIEQHIATSSSRDAIFVFVREKYIDKLVHHGRFEQALGICSEILLKQQIPLERFPIRDLAARCHLALGNRQEAYSLARSALSDWHRILEGLYTKQRKLNWLKRGHACLSCALASIHEPVSWMTEEDRRKTLFDLTELQKARLASDMMTQTGHVPGAYDLSKTMSSGGFSYEFFLSQSSRYPDWMPVCLLQVSALTSDLMTTVVHDDSGGARSFDIDLAPMKSMLQLPIDRDKQLLATASPLRFEGYDQSYSDELCSDLVMILSPERRDDTE